MIFDLRLNFLESKSNKVRFLYNVNKTSFQIIKLYAWEHPFLEKVVDARTKVLYFVKMSNIITAISNTTWLLMPYLVSVFYCILL